MSIDADILIDRRRMRRKLGWWRAIAFIALIAVVVTLGAWAGGFGDLGNKRAAHVARIEISGFITGDDRTVELIRDIAKNDHVKAVVLKVDSPGGATTGGETLYEELRKLAGKKPMVTTIDGLGASAGYMVAVASDHVVARRSAITGSIGVIMQWGNVSKLLETVGVKYEEVKSSPLKAEPQPFKPLSPEARAVLEGMIKDSYDWFVGIVAERRKLDLETARKLADGRVYTGNQALAAKLIDAIGGQDVAIAWLETERGIAKGLPVVDWKPRPVSSEDWGLARSFANEIVRSIGLEGFVPERPRLDGLISVWHVDTLGNNKNTQGVGQ